MSVMKTNTFSLEIMNIFDESVSRRRSTKNNISGNKNNQHLSNVGLKLVLGVERDLGLSPCKVQLHSASPPCGFAFTDLFTRLLFQTQKLQFKNRIPYTYYIGFYNI